MESISTATDFEYNNGQEYFIKATGGALAVEFYTPAGATVAVSGSPLADGDSLFFLDETANGKVKMTPTGTVLVSFLPTDR